MSIFNIAQAAEDSLVSCTGFDCGVCGFLQTFSNIYNYLLGISFAVAVLILVTAGYFYIFTTGRKRYLQKAKVFAKNGLIGFVFILAGWIVIHTLFSLSGYQKGSWWQLECSTEVAAYQSVDLDSIKSYANVADFVASGNTQGVIKNPVSDAVFMKMLENLAAGDKLTFYLPAKDNNTQEEIIVPFLAGYKDSSGNINIDSLQAQLLTNLVDLTSEDSKDSVSFVDALGKMLSPAQSVSLVDKLFKGLFGIDSASLSLDEKIEYASNYTIDFQEQNPVTSSSSTIEKVINKMMTKALEDTAVVAEISKNSSGSSKTTESTSKTADRSETKGYDPNKWKNTQDQQKEAQKEQKEPASSSDDWSDLIDKNKEDADKDKDKSKDSSLCDDDWTKGKGRMGILMGLRRLYKRDRLRYEMMFRFVDTVGDKPGGGECTGCGKIKVDHSAMIYDIAHILVHEGTHSGQFCLNLMGPYEAQGIREGQPGRGKIEAIACANAMGAIEKNKGHKNMEEFRSGSEGAVENLPSVTLGAGSGQGGDNKSQIRGNLARYWTKVTPKGDLDKDKLSDFYDYMTKYPITQGLPQNYYPAGNNHYGFCPTDPDSSSGESKYLKLQAPEEEVVKKIVTAKKLPEGPNCKSSPPKDLLPPCKKGDKPAPLPQIEACKGAPEMNIQ